MERLGSAVLPCALAASVALGGCGGAVYMPRPSPRIQMVPEGTSLVLVKDGRRYAMGPFGGDVDEAVRGNARAEEEAKSYRDKSIAAFVLSTLGGVGTGVGAGLLIYDDTKQTPDNGLLYGSLGALIGGLTVSLVGSILAANAQPHLWNAINIYNDGLPVAPAYPVWPQPYAAPPAYPGYPAAAPAAPALPAPLPVPSAGAPATPAPAPTQAPPAAPAPAPPASPPR
jgi:hypothetical protein